VTCFKSRGRSKRNVIGTTGKVTYAVELEEKKAQATREGVVVIVPEEGHTFMTVQVVTAVINITNLGF
jgi:hypothetical protein